MSYHIYIKNNKEIIIEQVLNDNYIPKNVKIKLEDNKSTRSKLEKERFFIPFESSRGVWVIKENNLYDIEIDVGASTDDYFLATRIALCLATLNNSTIIPEHYNEMNIKEFEYEFTLEWAKKYRTYGVESIIDFAIQNAVILSLNGCIRDYCFGEKLITLFKQGNPTIEEISDKLINDIRKVQYIEYYESDIEIPSLKQANFHEGTKSFYFISPEFKLLVLKTDYVILSTDERMIKLEFEKFTNYYKEYLISIDECQFILNPIPYNKFNHFIDFFKKMGTKLFIENRVLIELNVLL